MNTARTSTPTTDAIETEILSSDDVGRTVARIAHQIIEKTALDADDAKRVVLLGIPSGGVPLAERLAHLIHEFAGITVATGHWTSPSTAMIFVINLTGLSNAHQFPTTESTERPSSLSTMFCTPVEACDQR